MADEASDAADDAATAVADDLWHEMGMNPAYLAEHIVEAVRPIILRQAAERILADTSHGWTTAHKLSIAEAIGELAGIDLMTLINYRPDAS